MKGGGNERRSSAWRRRWFVCEGEPGRHHEVYTDSDQQKGGGMKRLVLLLAVMGTTLALAAGMALAQANTVTFTEKLPFNQILVNPCTGELVQFTGDILFLFHITEDANGGLHVQEHGSAAGITGTGESGTQYRLVGVTRDEFYFAPGEPREETFVNRFHVVSKGSSDNFLVDQTMHLTINANGEPTAEVIREDLQCVG
jgi:hypothetical protein